MQADEFSFALIAMLQFIPSLLLSILFLVDVRKTRKGERTQAFLGLGAFTLFTISFLMTTIFRYQFVINYYYFSAFLMPFYIIAFATIRIAAIILLAFWALAISRPAWFWDRRVILAIIGVLFGVAYVGLGIFSFFSFYSTFSPIFSSIQTVIALIIFIFAFTWVLLQATTEKTTLILFVGLVLLYFHGTLPEIPIYGYLELHHITLLGLWLVLIWKIVSNKHASFSTEKNQSSNRPLSP
jgi:hypothetical protein